MAVDVRGVSKSYTTLFGKATPLLRDVDIQVQVGHVYCVLGPSGCGKTTLLKCIMGQLKVDTGEVLVFGKPPGTAGLGVPGPRMGYMPQDIALIQDLTISEMLSYFGRLLQMPAIKIHSRIEFLLDLLHLPEKTRLVKNLSGGQQRRLSFACALIHEPDLLILDEPTVGVDPLLRKSIWEHFMHLAQDSNCTIIITTHYIEEANKAFMIAFMRYGRILAQSTPQDFIETYQMQTLEDVFHTLCSAEINDRNVQTSERRSITAMNPSQDQSNVTTTHVNYKPIASTSNICPNSSRLKAVFCKNLIRFRRNPGLWIIQVLLPVTIAVVSTFIFDNFNGLGISYVNDDVGSFGQLYMQHLNTDAIKLTRYSTKIAAKDSVRQGDSWATICIQKNFSASITERFTNGIFADDMAINGSEVNVQMDMINLQIVYVLSNEIFQAYQRFSTDVLQKLGLDPNIGKPPISFVDNIYNSGESLHRDFFTSGVIIFATFFIACGSSAVVLLMERSEGIWDRNWVAGLTEIELVLSNFASESVVLCGQLILVFTYVIFISPLPCKGPVTVLIIVALLQGLCGISCGFALSVVSKNMIYCTGFYLGAMYATVDIGGFFWPLQAAPTFVQYIGNVLPQTYAMEAARSIMSRGWSLQYQTVWLSVVIVMCWIIICNILSMIVLRLRR